MSVKYDNVDKSAIKCCDGMDYRKSGTRGGRTAKILYLSTYVKEWRMKVGNWSLMAMLNCRMRSSENWNRSDVAFWDGERKAREMLSGSCMRVVEREEVNLALGTGLMC
jgi:hypothetical protein